MEERQSRDKYGEECESHIYMNALHIIKVAFELLNIILPRKIQCQGLTPPTLFTDFVNK